VHGKPRIKLPLTEEAPLSTTKSDGMCAFPGGTVQARSKDPLNEPAKNQTCPI
jgi:hypothetical protein